MTAALPESVGLNPGTHMLAQASAPGDLTLSPSFREYHAHRAQTHTCKQKANVTQQESIFAIHYKVQLA